MEARTLEQRISILERTLARQRKLGLGLGLLIAGTVAIGAAKENASQSIPDVIRAKTITAESVFAERVSVVDDVSKRGGVRISLAPSKEGKGRMGISSRSIMLMHDAPDLPDSDPTSSNPRKENSGANGKTDPCLVYLGASEYGGTLSISSKDGKDLVRLRQLDAEGDGCVEVFNSTGEKACTLKVDEKGNGEIGAWDRKGKGHTLKPEP